MIAMKVRDDPFGKVKKMVQDLIIRLKEQANEEAQHKQWCDTEIAQNEKSRTTRTDEVEKLQTEIDSLTSMSAKLTEEISMLSADIVEVDKASAEQTAIREESKTTNAATVKDSQEAQTAITNAITMLKNFYAEAAEAVALVQDKKQPSGVTIKKIFDGASPFSGSYNGKQGENTGVVGILEVIQSDFARLESETSAAEVTEQEDYNKFMKDSAVNKATKQADIKHKTSKKTNAETRLGEIRADLAATSKELEAAQKYYEELKPSCFDTNVSVEDRDARRKEEIQSLQEAMRILNGEDMAV
jgi:predicted  nucleic acid-binding Zn-ribbon protein